MRKHTLFFPLLLSAAALFLLGACVELLPKTRAALNEAAPKKKEPAVETFTNSIGMEFVKIPAGSNVRGCGLATRGVGFMAVCQGDNDERRRISISTFWMGRYEVTQEQWTAVMGSNPSKFQNPTNPVDSVSWKDAQEFIRRLNKKEGHKRYRLPTEAEWEYAARAGGDSNDGINCNPENCAWYYRNSGKVGGLNNRYGHHSHPVGQLAPNAWGLYDMHGNVWEWCQDWYGEKYYKQSGTTDPKGPKAGTARVLRGGSYGDGYKGITYWYRGSNKPGARKEYNGFRVALSPER